MPIYSPRLQGLPPRIHKCIKCQLKEWQCGCDLCNFPVPHRAPFFASSNWERKHYVASFHKKPWRKYLLCNTHPSVHNTKALKVVVMEPLRACRHRETSRSNDTASKAAIQMVGIALVSTLTVKCDLGFSASVENRNKKVLTEC